MAWLAGPALLSAPAPTQVSALHLQAGTMEISEQYKPQCPSPALDRLGLQFHSEPGPVADTVVNNHPSVPFVKEVLPSSLPPLC